MSKWQRTLKEAQWFHSCVSNTCS